MTYNKCLLPFCPFIVSPPSLIRVSLSPVSQALVQALEQESTDLFADLVKTASLTGTQVGDLLVGHETSVGSQVEGQMHRLEQEVAQLRWKSEELSGLADMQDHACFLKVMSVNQDTVPK